MDLINNHSPDSTDLFDVADLESRFEMTPWLAGPPIDPNADYPEAD